jgi:hypothetical protein
MVARVPDLWALAQEPIHIDPGELTEAIEAQVASGDLDYRTRVLIRDSMKALRHHWGEERVAAWLKRSYYGDQILTICRGPWEDDRGFPSLMSRVRDTTRPETIQQFFNDLGHQIRKPIRLYIGGSAALILPGYLSRSTEDVDVVNELPPELRSQHTLLQHLKEVHGLELAHFQSHYLPMGWEQRVHSLAPFDLLQVYLVDVYDVFLSKLFSARTKDRQDLKALAPQLDKETLVRRLKETTQSMLAAPGLQEKAENNWNMLYGESLPS